MKTKDLVIIGGGSAGMAAAISAFDSGIKDILIIDRNEMLGGILNQCVHDGFGLELYKEALTGPEFAARLISGIKERNIEYKLSTFVTDLSKDKVVTFMNETEGSVSIQAKAIILSTGCYERSPGAIALPGDRPSGVITAGQAQLFLNEKGYLVGKKVFILGSGDIGLIMARRMTLEGAKVLGVAEIMPYSNGLNRNIVQCLNDFNIPLYLSHTVSKVIGKSKLERIEISQVNENLEVIPGTEKSFEVDTLLLSVGLIPYSQLFAYAGGVMGPTKGPLVDEHYETSIPGIFACGNGLHVHDLVDIVVTESNEAGKASAKFIKNELKETKTSIRTKALNGIGYVVPGLIHVENIEDFVTIKFRVKKPVKNVTLDFSLNGDVIKTVKRPVLIPSEMQQIKLEKSLFNIQEGELTLSIK